VVHAIFNRCVTLADSCYMIFHHCIVIIQLLVIERPSNAEINQHVDVTQLFARNETSLLHIFHDQSKYEKALGAFVVSTNTSEVLNQSQFFQITNNNVYGLMVLIHFATTMVRHSSGSFYTM